MLNNQLLYFILENLEIDSESDPIKNIKIGRYFESYHGNYYVPNEQTLSEYPQDIEAREKAMSLCQHAHKD